MRGILPRTTFGLAALISALLSVLTIATGYFAQHVAHEELEQQLDHRISQEVSLLMKEHARGGAPALVAALEKRSGGHALNGMGYLLVEASGARLAGELEVKTPPPGRREFLRVGQGETRSFAQAITTALPDGGRLVVAADRTPVEEIDATIRNVTFTITLGMVALSITGAWLLGASVRARIENINRVALAISEGRIEERIARDARAGEFDRLASTLNHMLDRNAALLTNLQQVSTDIAHDLRTPLGRQQQLLELALVECKDVACFRRAVEKAALAGQEMQQIFTALLRISELESQTLRASFASVDLTEVAERVVDAFRPDIEAGGWFLQSSLASNALVAGDRHLLSQMLVNLIENAMRHTPPGTVIQVGVCVGPSGVELTVEDNGPGVDAADRARVLQRFVRLERSRSTPGHGLGLSLVKAIVGAHGAAMELVDALPGLRVLVRFAASQRPGAG